MRLPVDWAHRSLVLLAGLIGTVAIDAACTWARSGDAIPQAAPDAARPLPPIVRLLLAEALAREQMARLRGPRHVAPPESFPMPTCLFEHGLCGAVNRDGSIAVAPRFDFVDEFHEGRAVVRSSGLYGYVDAQGNLIAEPQYAIAGRFRLGYAEVDIGGKSSLIDLEGRQVLEPRFASVFPFNKNSFWVNEGVRDYHGPPGGEEFLDLDSRYRGHQIRVRGKWGLVDANGAWIREPEFRDIAIFDPENSEVMWADARWWGLIKPDGTWFLEPTFHALEPTFHALYHVSKLSDGLAAVWRDQKSGYVDRTGRIAIPLEFDILADLTDFFVEGMPAPAKLGRWVGLIDRTGQWVLKPAYEHILQIYDRMYDGMGVPSADVAFNGFIAKLGEKYDVIDHAGKVIIRGLAIDLRILTIFGQNSSATSNGFPLFCADGRIIGVVDNKPEIFAGDGTPIRPSRGQIWWPLSCDVPYAIKIGDRFGFVDKALQPLTQARFEMVGQFRDGLATVKLEGKYGLIRTNGTWALEPDYDAVQPLQNELALVKVGGRASLIEVATGALVTRTRFEDACSLGRGIVGIMQDGKMGAIDEKGRWIFKADYEPGPFSFYQGFVPVRSGDKWGFLDAAGNTIEARFDEASRFERGVSWVKSDGNWCPIDRRGNKIPSLSCRGTAPINIQRASRGAWPCQIRP